MSYREPGTARGRRRGAIAAWSILLLTAGGSPFAAQEREPPATMQEALELQAREIAELRLRIERSPSDARAWEALIQLAADHAVFVARAEAEARGGSAGSQENLHRETSIAVCREWLAATPEEPRAHLALSNHLESFDRAAAMRRELLERFPGSIDVLEAIVRDLQRDGDPALEIELVEAFMARRPDDRRGYALAHGSYSRHRDDPSARRVLGDWLERFPGDPHALRLRLEELARERPAADRARALAAEIVERLEPLEGASQLCEALGRFAGGAALDQALSCYQRLLTAEELADHPESVALGLARLAVRRNDWDAVSAALGTLPPERRETGLGTVVAALARDGQCEAATAFGREIAAVRTRVDSLSNALRALGDCAGDPGAQALFLQLIHDVPVDELSILVTHSSGLVEAPGLEAALRRRLERQPASYQAWEALDRLYRGTGRDDRRIEHLTAWIEAEPRYRGTERHRELTDLLLARGRVEEAISALGAASRAEGSADDLVLVERLVDLLLLAQRPAEAEAASRRLLTGGGRSAHEGQRLLAHVAWARGDLGLAARRYEDYYSALPTGARAWGDDEYPVLLLDLGREGEALSFLENRWRTVHAEGGFTGGAERWLARQLGDLGRPDLALDQLERAVARAPRSVELYEEIARRAEEARHLERAEKAHRALIGLDPGQEARWSALAAFHLRNGRPDASIAVAGEARRHLSGVTPMLDLALARAYLEREDPTSAIRILQPLREQRPDFGAVWEELTRAYRMLGEQTP